MSQPINNPMNHVRFRGREIATHTFPIDGPKLILMEKFMDNRGSFIEWFNQDLFDLLELPRRMVQANLSETYKGVIRGMHLQRGNPQGKLVYCLSGVIEDVAVDLRPWSSTYGQHIKQRLTALPDSLMMLWVPPHFAHGFSAHSNSVVGYLCSTVYEPGRDAGIHAHRCGVDWGNVPGGGLWALSERDNQLPSLVDYAHDAE